MKIFVATDITATMVDDRVLANSKYSTILERYYKTFGKIVLCARATRSSEKPSGFCDITHMIDSIVITKSLGKMLMNQCNGDMKDAMEKCDIVVGRCPSISAYKAFDVAKRMKKPYFSESMGCAWDAYWNHSVVGKMIAPYMFFKMKSVVKNSDYALYVTDEFLQKRYPCKKQSVNASNVLIKSIDNSFLERRLEKIKESNFSRITMMTTAAVDVKYKGQEYVIKAIPLLNKKGIQVRYVVVGEGNDSYLRSVAKKYGIEDQVVFVGRLPLDKVFELIDETDIYIQPSLQEGLPRSVIEAMSRACPCIGARTAGIPELISPECVVKRKSSKEIADTVVAIANKEKMTELAQVNFEKSKDFLDSVISDRRNAYYEKIKSDLKG